MADAQVQQTKTRRQRLEEREAAIVAVAHDAFVKNGFEGTKMADIARLAGVAEGTVYLYFKNKNALLLAVIGRFYQELTRGAEDGIKDTKDTYARLTFLANHHIERCLADWRILELMIARFREVSEYQSDMPYEYNKSYVAVFDRVVRAAIHKRELRDDVPHWIIRDLFFGSLEYAMRTHILKNAPDDEIQVIVTNVIDLLQRGVGAKPAQSTATDAIAPIVDRLERVADRLDAVG
ncbi:MAG: TetR/AcrR family transcriptional regulator [Pseudomonadota bacterium]